MPTYINLIKYTETGIQNIRDSPARLDAAKGMFKSLGAELKEFYLTLGRYDIVIVCEAPDDETAAKLSLAVSSKGAVSVETLRAFTEEEYRGIIASLPA